MQCGLSSMAKEQWQKNQLRENNSQQASIDFENPTMLFKLNLVKPVFSNVGLLVRSTLAIAFPFIMAGMCLAAEPGWTPGSSNGLREISPAPTAPTEPAPYPNSQADLSPINDNQVQLVTGDRYGTSAPVPSVTPSNQFQALRKLPNAATKPAPQKSIKQTNEFQMRLTALELAVSTVVAERPNLWRFEPLEAEATQLLLLSSTEVDRQAVREIAERLEHFSDIAQRYRDNRVAFSIVARDRSLNSSRNIRKEPSDSKSTLATSNVAPSPVTRSQYDATGVLRPVVSKRPNAPKFALVDDQGRLTTFVTPTAGVDLEPLVGKRLGVRGNRGFIPEYQREHVTAERVATLDRVVR